MSTEFDSGLFCFVRKYLAGGGAFEGNLQILQHFITEHFSTHLLKIRMFSYMITSTVVTSKKMRL